MRLTGRRVLAFGTAGAQGSGLVPALLARGAVPVRATSRPERAERWRAAGEQAVVADITDPDAVVRAAEEHRVAAVTAHIPLPLTVEGSGSGDGSAAVIASIRALREAGLTVTVNVGAPVAPPGVPDVYRNRPVAESLIATGASVLTPTLYLDNHAAPWSLSRIAAGELFYPRPASDPVAWISAADLGRAATAALAEDLLGELLVLAGPQVLTFDDLAVEFGAGLGRELRFVGVTPAEFGDALRPLLGDRAAAGVRAAYESQSPEPNPLVAPAVADATWARLGIVATTARDWAATVLRPAFEAFAAGRG